MVMDIKKEREEFELNISPVIWERIEYNAENNIYMAKSKYWTSSIVQAVANEIDFGWKMWQAAKAQAVTEGFVLVSKERLAKAVDGIEALFKEDCTLALGELLPIQQDLNDMIEGLEYTITELSIDWGMECPICNHNEATCYSTATQESSYEFMDGDVVVCLKCGNKGEMDADGENSDIAWDEAQEQNQ